MDRLREAGEFDFAFCARSFSVNAKKRVRVVSKSEVTLKTPSGAEKRHVNTSIRVSTFYLECGRISIAF